MGKVASGQRARGPARPGSAAEAQEEELPDAAAAADEADAEPAALDLADLVSDPSGEVVLFNDSGLRALALGVGDAEVVRRGRSGRHVTAAGEDVSGFRYVEFRGGLKLFHHPDLELILVP